MNLSPANQQPNRFGYYFYHLDLYRHVDVREVVNFLRGRKLLLPCNMYIWCNYGGTPLRLEVTIETKADARQVAAQLADHWNQHVQERFIIR